MDAQKKSELKAKVVGHRRRWPWVLGAAAVLILLLLLLAPVLVSSRSVTNMILAKVNRATGGTAGVGDLSVGWLKGLRISEFSYRDGAGWTSINVQKIAAQPQLTSLLGGNLTLGKTVIDKPQVAIDLRHRPTASTASGPPAASDASAARPAAAIALTSDIVVNDGNLRVTDTTGKTVEISQINSQMSVRPPGQASSMQVDMIVADAGQPGRISASGHVAPSKKKDGWSLKGTTGEFTVEVNDLNVESLGSLLALAGVDFEGTGTVSGDAKTDVVDGQLQDVTASVRATNLDVTSEQLQGDRLKTSVLNVDAQLKHEGQTLRIDKLDAQTDWASLSATGVVPMTVKSLTDLLQSESAFDLTGQFDCDVAALLTQMPKTFGLKEGMKITGGRADGSIRTTTEGGRAALTAQTRLAGLAGTVDGKELSFSEPVVANFKLSADETKTQLENLDVSAAFAKVNANGDFQNISYNGTVNLSKLQTDLGQFANLGPYEVAGEFSSAGQVAIEPNRTSVTGSASVKQLVLAAADGNSVSEPGADVDFSLSIDKAKQAVAVDNIGIKGTFGQVTVKDATVPLAKSSPEPMKLNATVRNLDLAKTKPYAVLFASFPREAELAGIVESDLTITTQDSKYRLYTETATIRNLHLKMPGKKPFDQNPVTVRLNAEMDPNERSFALEDFLLESPDIKIKKGRFETTRRENENRIEGALQGQSSGQVVGRFASTFLPENLELTGLSTVNLNFASTYPADEPARLLANLDSQGQVGLNSAKYMGLNFGAIDVNVAIVEGLMRIAPFTTTVNEGQLQFAAQADFKEEPTLLRIPEPLLLANRVKLNTETTEKLLKYLNPIFANLVSVSGQADFDCEKLVIPLTAGHERDIQIVGTISADNLELGASGLLNQLFTAAGQSLRDQRATIRPTKITVQDGTVRYDNMQIDIGDNPLSFGGAIGLDGRLDMTVTLPWTWRGRTARSDREGQAGTRISIPLRGTVDKPELDMKNFLGNQLLRGLEDLLRR